LSSQQKTLEDGQKEAKETREADGSTSNLVNPRIVNDIPLIGEQPTESEPDFGRPFQKRPVRDPKAFRFDNSQQRPYGQRDEPTRFSLDFSSSNRYPIPNRSKFFPEPSVNRTSKVLPLQTSSYNQIQGVHKPANSQYLNVATPRPATTARPIVHHHYHSDDYYNDYDDAPINPDFTDDYPINDKVEPLKKDNQRHPDYSDDYPINDKVEPLNFKARDYPAPQANRDLLDVYKRPSRVLYADSSRPGNNRNPKFVSQSNLKFPARTKTSY
jgi:hypothetical protein